MLWNPHGGNSNWNTSKGSSICKHNGKTVVFEAEGKRLYGSKGFDLDETSDKWQLIIDLASNIYVPVKKSFIRSSVTAKKFRELDQYTIQPYKPEPKAEVLALDWPDMSTPPVEYEFWIDLWKMLPTDTVVACVGGHGRTGTCLVALAIASGLDYYTALETIRKNHCDKAVETLGQEKYLHEFYIYLLEDKIVMGDKSCEEVLAYAKANPPTIAKPKEVEFIDMGGYTNVGGVVKFNGNTTRSLPEHYSITEADGDAVELEIGGKHYIRACVDKGCRDWLYCNDPRHEAWIEEEFYNKEVCESWQESTNIY